MRYIHNAKLTVFLKPEEYSGNILLIEKFKTVFHKLVKQDFDKEKISIIEENVESFENRKIKILTLEISKEAHTNVFLKTLKELLGKEQCTKILEQKTSRLDEELYFYIRLNKESVLKEIYELTDSGDCIHIKLHVAAFPKNKESALKTVGEMFK
jgi:RNA-binding protein